MYGFNVNVYTNHKSLQYVFTQNELNIRQKRLLELLNDYDTSNLYLPVKANLVSDDLSHITMGNMSHVEESKNDLMKYVHTLARMGVRFEESANNGFTVHHNSDIIFGD